MNIEISPKEYEKKLNWYDGNMYCQLLTIDGNNDWRLPTMDELDDILKIEDKSPFWYSNKTFSKSMFGRIPIDEVRFGIIPVRGII